MSSQDIAFTVVAITALVMVAAVFIAHFREEARQARAREYGFGYRAGYIDGRGGRPPRDFS